MEVLIPEHLKVVLEESFQADLNSDKETRLGRLSLLTHSV